MVPDNSIDVQLPETGFGLLYRPEASFGNACQGRHHGVVTKPRGPRCPARTCDISIYPELSGKIGFAKLNPGRQSEMKQMLKLAKGRSLSATLRGPISSCVHRISSASEVLQLHEEALQWAEASVKSTQSANDAFDQGRPGT